MNKLILNKENIDSILGKVKAKHKDEDIILGNQVLDIERIPTGSIGLDEVTGGGYPIGRFIELYGAESSGKSTCSLYAMVEAQKKFPDKWVVYLDFEHSFDRKYAETIGLNMDGVLMIQPNSGESGFDMVKEMMNEIPISMVVVDSIAAATPKAEIEGDIGDVVMGKHARMMGQVCRTLTPLCKKHDTTIIFINQTREKIGVMFGNPTTTTGGNSMKFYASVRLELSKKQGDIKDEDGIILNNFVKVKSVKNKTAPPYKQCEFTVWHGEGIDKINELITWGEKYDIIKKSGSWYSYEGTKLGQGLNNTRDLLKDNIELCEEIEQKINAKMKE